MPNFFSVSPIKLSIEKTTEFAVIWDFVSPICRHFRELYIYNPRLTNGVRAVYEAESMHFLSDFRNVWGIRLPK